MRQENLEVCLNLLHSRCITKFLLRSSRRPAQLCVETRKRIAKFGTFWVARTRILFTVWLKSTSGISSETTNKKLVIPFTHLFGNKAPVGCNFFLIYYKNNSRFCDNGSSCERMCRLLAQDSIQCGKCCLIDAINFIILI